MPWRPGLWRSLVSDSRHASLPQDCCLPTTAAPMAQAHDQHIFKHAQRSPRAIIISLKHGTEVGLFSGRSSALNKRLESRKTGTWAAITGRWQPETLGLACIACILPPPGITRVALNAERCKDCWLLAASSHSTTHRSSRLAGRERSRIHNQCSRCASQFAGVRRDGLAVSFGCRAWTRLLDTRYRQCVPSISRSIHACTFSDMLCGVSNGLLLPGELKIRLNCMLRHAECIAVGLGSLLRCKHTAVQRHVDGSGQTCSGASSDPVSKAVVLIAAFDTG